MQTFLLKHSRTFLIGWTLLIFVLCATPGQYIPSADWLELLSFDKFVHASLFFILTTLVFLHLQKNAASQLLMISGFLLCLLYGASLELMQAYCFSNRSADWKDMVANALGCFVALALLKKLKNIFAIT